ncbi:MAG: hypothetical protein GY697_28920, partial [Desulfobacterales bacterium]|nr:hypothetical protein [Desulfobacterales bacterium]
VFSASYWDNEITWYENDGSENFITHTITTGANAAISVTTADMDGDGDLDILSSSHDDDTIAWYENTAVTTLDGNPTFIEDGTAVVLDADVDISDLELDALNNYDGASVTLVRNTGADAEDEFSNDGQLGILNEGQTFAYDGTTIGTVTTNSGGTLVLTFNSNATSARVDSTLQSIAYSNISDDPPASVQINWSFDDGDGSDPKQATGSTTVTITPVNDEPVLTGDLTASINEGATYTITGTDLGYTDPDDVDAGITFTTSSASNGKIQVGGIDASSFTGTQLTAGQVTFIHDGSETLAASFDVNVEDGNEDVSTPSDSTFNFTITPVNDNAPVTTDNSYTLNEGALESGNNIISDNTGAGADSDSDLPADTLTIESVNGTARASPTDSTAGLYTSGARYKAITTTNPVICSLQDGTTQYQHD